MNFKNTNAAPTTITRDLSTLDEFTGNIYKTCVIVSKRANQISVELKEELLAKLNEFATSTDNLEEIFENREQIEISKFYERLPKPVAIALQEFIEGKIYFREPENTTDEI
ncbi:MAG: DNA-directed RNA polymerase subunit omega [Vicingaceae bacterium]